MNLSNSIEGFENCKENRKNIKQISTKFRENDHYTDNMKTFKE